MKVNDIPKGRAVSVEIECYGSVCVTNSDTVVGYDGSLGVGGVEVKIVGERSAKLVLPDLEAVAGCRVDTRCGLHVHIDVRDLTYTQAEQVYLSLASLSKHLKKLVPESRIANRYCRWRRNNNSARRNRYAALNFQAYHKYQTIEFRCQSGSVETEKITFWSEVCWQLVQWARTDPPQAPSSWLKFLRLLTPDVANWAAYRRAKLWEPAIKVAIDTAKAGGVLTPEQDAAIAAIGYSMASRTAMRQPARSAQRIFGHGIRQVLYVGVRAGLNFTELSNAMRRLGVKVSGSCIRQCQADAFVKTVTVTLTQAELAQLKG